MGKLIQKGTQALGLTADPTTGEGAMRQSAALQERAVRELEKIGIPEIEAQKIVLERPELVLSTLEEKLGPSAMEDIQIDPRLQQAEMAALADIQEAGKEGFTAEDRARIEALRSQIGADEQARQASILQGMAQRGTLDSGAQLAAQLGSSQAATQRASQEAMQLAAQQAAARRNALAQAGQMAGQMGSRQFGQQAQQAGASDAIKQFNASVAARDTAAKQQYAQQRANITNQQEMYNKGLIQQQFQNEIAKATGISGALGNQAQGAMNQAQMQAQAAQQAAAGTRGLVIGGVQALATAKGSDIRLKKNIDSISSSADSEKIHEMFDKAKPYEYDYKDTKYGKGKHSGLMAQDLEKSEIGKEFVINTPEGKMVDYGKMSSTLAAGMSDLHKRVKELEGKKFTNGGRQMMAGDGTSDVGSALNTQEEVVQANSVIENKDKKTASFKDILESFSDGYDQGSALIKPAEVGNINPIKIQAPQQSTQSMNALQAIRQKLLGQAMANGGMKDHQGMNYNAGGEGVVIKSLEDSYAGDELPDKINDGEMVLNLDQQDTFNSLLKELGERRRADEKVQSGEAVINEPQQDRLMAVAREEADPEELVDGGSIVEDVQETMPSQEGSEPIETGEYEKLLDALKMSQEGYEFAGGGRKPIDNFYTTPYSQEPNMSVESQVSPELPYSQMMSKEQTPEEKALDLESILAAYKPEENMSVGEPATPDYSQMMSVGEPADVSSISQANKIVESANSPKSDKPKMDEGESEQKTDEELRSAQNKDMLLTLLDNVDRALAHYDAANPNAKLTPVQKDRIKSDFEEKLLKARQMASQQADKKADREALTKYRQDTLVGQEQARKDLKEYRDKQLELAGKELEIKKDKATPEDKQLAKEQRKEQKELEKNLDDIKDKKEKIKKTLNTLKALEKENAVVDTGPLDQYVSNKTTTGRKLEQQFNELALDKMTKMFAGMSKAIDSDAEREFFMRSQPGMGQYSSNNKEILNDMLKGVESLEQKINNQLGKTPEKSKPSKKETSKTKTTEIRRKTKDGRIAIFDENKNFLRYEN